MMTSRLMMVYLYSRTLYLIPLEVTSGLMMVYLYSRTLYLIPLEVTSGLMMVYLYSRTLYLITLEVTSGLIMVYLYSRTLYLITFEMQPSGFCSMLHMSHHSIASSQPLLWCEDLSTARNIKCCQTKKILYLVSLLSQLGVSGVECLK